MKLLSDALVTMMIGVPLLIIALLMVSKALTWFFTTFGNS